MQFISFTVLIRRIKAIKSFLKDRKVPKRKKLLVIFGIIYLLMPIDLIPAPVLLFGLVDDAVLWLFILTHLRDELDSYREKSGETVSAEKDFRGKTIIESTAKEYDAGPEERGGSEKR